VSDSNEPGEGEHKVMAWIRARGEGSIVVYGLDADLILLSMLHRCDMDESLYLMREKAEFYDSGANCKFMYLSIDSLMDALFVKEDRKRHVLDYIAGMSFLGNDFLPHGLSFKIKEGGHERLLSWLSALHAERKWLVDEKGVLVDDSFTHIVSQLAATEEEDIRNAMKRKRVQKQGPPRSESEKAMLPIQNLPHDWFVEKCLGTENELVNGWRDVYRKWTPARAASYYRYGHQWILDYYMGRVVNTNWYFPWHLPPLMSDVLVNTETMPTLATDEPPRPQEQLALVLPMESWHLVRDRSLRELPTKIPQMWPSRFGFFSAGKRWMWECEADVPIFTPGRLRKASQVALTSSTKLQ
jgi:5'-3' exonuclease